MKDGAIIEVRIGRGAVVLLLLAATLFAAAVLAPGRLLAQKTQEKYGEKFNIASDTAGVGIATSTDGKYVYVVGPLGILVSDDFGKTGSWTQTVKLK